MGMGMINLSLQQTEARKEGLLLLGDTGVFFQKSRLDLRIHFVRLSLMSCLICCASSDSVRYLILLSAISITHELC